MIWDLTVDDDQRLTIIVTPGVAGQPVPPITGTAAYGFILSPEDNVVLVFKWQGATSTGDINYAVTGTNLDLKDLEKLKSVIGAAAPAPALTAGRVAGAPTHRIVKAVTDDLTAGGRLTVTVTLKDKEGSGTNNKEVTLYTSGGVTFKIEPRSPRFTVSTGLAVSTAPEPTVAIVKTSNIITFEKDDKTQQAYEQQIILRDDDASLKPIQTAVTFANFRLIRRLYGTLGVQLNEKIFEEPLLGLTYRHPIAASMGVNFTVGMHFSHETAIVESSGFEDGMKLDPTIGLTVDDIPTETHYHRRFAFAFSVDF